MGCQGCGFKTAADFAFCPKCGSRLATACPACDFACPPDFAFCPRCGARLAPAVAPPIEPMPTPEGRPDPLQE